MLFRYTGAADIKRIEPSYKHSMAIVLPLDDGSDQDLRGLLEVLCMNAKAIVRDFSKIVLLGLKCVVRPFLGHSNQQTPISQARHARGGS
jgi:hypothetical protein